MIITSLRKIMSRIMKNSKPMSGKKVRVRKGNRRITLKKRTKARKRFIELLNIESNNKYS